ncbi:peroxiredoxin-like family protein [Parapedobacter koreensis]|nr:peroxiredoxin-like family protein [Parapedobacter koreensis]
MKKVNIASLVAFCCLAMLILPSVLKAQQANMMEEKPLFPQKPEDISPLLIGENIPMATLQDAAGRAIDLNKLVAAKPTILIFYRGGWCPFCSKQLSGLQDIAPELEQQGYQLVAVSTDAPEGLMQSATKEKLSYTLLSDADLAVSKQFGIAFKAPKGYWEMLPKTTDGKNVDLLLPVPSVFILDTKGVIQFEYINPDFKQRLSPELLTAVAASIKKDH